MENASKALIIAGAILLSILIIALGIYVFNMAKGATNTKALDDLEISEFNSQFTTYDGQNIGSNVTSLLDKLISNVTSNKDSDDRLPDVVYAETRNNDKGAVTSLGGNAQKSSSIGNTWSALMGNMTNSGIASSNVKSGFFIDSNSGNTQDTISAYNSLRNNIAVRHYYQVTHDIDNNTGLVKTIFIMY